MLEHWNPDYNRNRDRKKWSLKHDLVNFLEMSVTRFRENVTTD